ESWSSGAATSNWPARLTGSAAGAGVPPRSAPGKKYRRQRQVDGMEQPSQPFPTRLRTRRTPLAARRTGPYFDATAASNLIAFAAEVSRHPVFRIVPITEGNR